MNSSVALYVRVYGCECVCVLCVSLAKCVESLQISFAVHRNVLKTENQMKCNEL